MDALPLRSKRLCFIRADVATAGVNAMRSCLPAFKPERWRSSHQITVSRRAITCSRATIREAAKSRAFCVPFGTEEPLTSAAHAALRRTAFYIAVNNYGSPRNVFFFPLIPTKNSGTDRR